MTPNFLRHRILVHTHTFNSLIAFFYTIEASGRIISDNDTMRARAKRNKCPPRVITKRGPAAAASDFSSRFYNNSSAHCAPLYRIIFFVKRGRRRTGSSVATAPLRLLLLFFIIFFFSFLFIVFRRSELFYLESFLTNSSARATLYILSLFTIFRLQHRG